ncbi:spermatogenesis-associated protein 31D3-like [Meriones unguiculatus]|uniref:spermatogenesis-associated protein 31D3-like n=1 Tax=Meriones unguiculatus TaxID=10047 RepID=UPI000B4E9CBE|nr:spermatogenesis-associated protein 31D3-like [Meriones unguiculatus]
MEDVLSFLSNTTKPCLLSFGSVFMDFYPKGLFLSAVGVLLLYLTYPILKPFLATRTNHDTHKQRGKVNRRRRVSYKEFRIFHREAQERRRLLSIVQSPLGQMYDPSHLRQVLCPDPCCDVCNRATAKVSRLLSWASLRDDAASVSSMTSTASVTETSFTLLPSLSPSPSRCHISSLPPSPPPPTPSIPSTIKATPLEDIVLVTPQGDSRPSELISVTRPYIPLGHILPHPLPMSPPKAQHATQQMERPLKREATPSMAGRPRKQLTNATTNKGSCGALSELSRQQTGADDSVSPSQLEGLVNQETHTCHSSEAYLGGQNTGHFTVPGNLPFPSSQVLAVRKRQDKSQADVLTRKDEGKKEYFQKALAIWEKKIGPVAEVQQHSDGSLCLRDSKGVLSRLNVHQALVQLPASTSHLEPKLTQHFWGLPYLHSESMGAITTLSTHCSSACIWFNRTSDTPAVTHRTPLSLPESQSQTLTQSQSQSVLLQPLIPLPPAPPPPLPPQPQLSICGVYFHGSQDVARSLLQSEIHCLEYSIVTKEQEKGWGLPSVVQKSQEEICPLPSKPSLASQASETHVLKSVSSGQFPLTNAFRKKLEHHLRKRLILQRWGLPQGIYKSQSWMRPDLPEASESSCGLPCSSLYKHQDSKNLPKTVLNQPGSSQERFSEAVSLKGKVGKAEGHSPEIVQKCPWSNTKGALDNGLQSDCKTSPPCHSGSPPSRPSGTSQVSQCRKKIEAALQEHLSRHLYEINHDQVPDPTSRSGPPPPPLTSCVSIKDHKAQRQSPPDNKVEHVKNIQRTAKSVMQQTSIILDSTSLEKSQDNIHSRDVPRMSAKAGPVPLEKRLSSDETVHGPQKANMNDKNVFAPSKVSNIAKGGQLSGLQPQPTKILKTSQCKSTQGADGNTTKAHSTLLAGRAMKGTSGPQEIQTSDFNTQVSWEEEFKSESSQTIQAVETQHSVLFISDKFTSKALLKCEPSSQPVDAAWVQQARLSTAGPSVEQQQEPRMPPSVLDKGQNKELPPSAKMVCPVPRRAEELSAGVAGAGTVQASGKSYHTQGSPIQRNRGEKPTQPLPAKAPTPPEHQFRKHVKHFFQWLAPDRKCKGQEVFLRKGTPPSSPRYDPKLKGRATLPGNTVAQKAMRDLGEISKEQAGHKQAAADSMHPHAPSCPPTKPVRTMPRKEYGVPAEAVQGHQFCHQATHSTGPTPRPYNQALAFGGQKRSVEERGRQPQKCEALQPRPPAPHREPELCQNPLKSRQVPQPAPPFAVGTLLADVSRLCGQKILAQNFSGKSLFPPK